MYTGNELDEQAFIYHYKSDHHDMKRQRGRVRDALPALHLMCVMYKNKINVLYSWLWRMKTYYLNVYVNKICYVADNSNFIIVYEYKQ